MIYDLPGEDSNAVATVILAHGAGAGAESEFMASMAQLLAQQNINVVRFNFAYMQTVLATGKRRPPDRMPRLLECFNAVIARVTQQWPTLPLFVGGKSMGGRVATMLLDDSPARGGIALGYPFHPPGKPDKLRTEHLESLQKPLLIVQGERDTFGTQKEVRGYSLSSAIDTQFLADGDHSFKPRKASGYSQQQHIAAAARHCQRFIAAHL
ncbi:alpha/beta family hydrolase [Alteromonas gilva]|uniref:alpha/beta family hydrolase n=1 Tax=Alteromonas gilva TaxID=2987522 RepID=UPI0035ABF4F2